VWLSVCSEVEMISYGVADAATTPPSLAPVKSTVVYLYASCPGKRPLNRCSSSSSSSSSSTRDKRQKK